MNQPVYRLLGINPETETGWVSYCIGLVIFNVLGVIAVFLIQRLQLFLPFNPQDMVNISVDSFSHTAIALSPYNWQGYGGLKRP